MQVIPPAWLRLFSTTEMRQLLSGGEGGAVDVADLRAHTVYSGGYTAKSRAVATFWSVRAAATLRAALAAGDDGCVQLCGHCRAKRDAWAPCQLQDCGHTLEHQCSRRRELSGVVSEACV